MKRITVIICGTVHDTMEETKLFGVLNNIMDENANHKKNIHWLCEGDSYGRKCTTLKNNTIHLLTDALFVNMLILDFVRENVKSINDEFIEMLYERSIELFVTISKFDDEIHKLKELLQLQKNNDCNILCKISKLFAIKPNFNLQVQYLVKPEYQEYINLIKNQTPIKQIYDKIKIIPLDKFMIDMRELVSKIIMYMKDRDLIDKNYEKCVFDFYDTGLVCEDKILTILREQSFTKIILEKINSLNLTNGKHMIIVTVGADHCEPLSKILQKFNIRTKIVKFVNN
jgi:hypothetical protein